MRLTVRLFAVLRERAGSDALELELPGGATVADLKRAATEACPQLGDLAHVAGVVGTEYAPDDRPLAEGDEVALLPPVSGGAHDYEAGVFELSGEPLDVADLAGRVGHPSCGAVVTFTGVTRERNRGQEVVRLDYEAFDAMAWHFKKGLF